MDLFGLAPWPFGKQGEDSLKSIEIPQNARVKYYQDITIINNLRKYYLAANIRSELYFEKITSLPVLVVYDPGGIIYFVHTDADFAPVKHALPEPKTPPRTAQLLADSSISLDRQYIRNGEPVKIRVFLTKALRSVNIRVYKISSSGPYHNLSSFPRELPAGETVGTWDGEVGDDLGVYGVLLEGAEDDGLIFRKTRILKSVATVEVV
jgi:hypothetical protein